MVIDFNFNKERKRRKISPLETQYILSYMKNKSLNNNDFLIFNHHIDNKAISREQYISWRIVNEINKRNFFEKRDFKLIIKELHSIRNTKKIHESIYISKNFENMDQDGKLFEKNEII